MTNKEFNNYHWQALTIYKKTAFLCAITIALLGSFSNLAYIIWLLPIAFIALFLGARLEQKGSEKA